MHFIFSVENRDFLVSSIENAGSYLNRTFAVDLVLSVDEWSTRCIVPLSIAAIVRVVAGNWSFGRPLKAATRDQLCTSSDAMAAVTLIAMPIKTMSGPLAGDRHASRRRRSTRKPKSQLTPGRIALVELAPKSECWSVFFDIGAGPVRAPVKQIIGAHCVR